MLHLTGIYFKTKLRHLDMLWYFNLIVATLGSSIRNLASLKDSSAICF